MIPSYTHGPREWNIRYKLVDGRNFGSQGDPPAAMRYTGDPVTKLAEAMVEDIEKDTVDFQLNFDDSMAGTYRIVLPTRIPQLLVNGSSGIAVGMANNMMPAQLNEVIDALHRVYRRQYYFHRRPDQTC